ncbi:MAG: class I mannose-6-phosphate isomerase [Oscillospiraceae bacterium]|nr:class I mannose-6-phosphate isomerase [Oscillospiraceae bacterium]
MIKKIKKYPYKLKPVLKDAIWAGTRLASEFAKSENPNQKIAESWELTVHKNGVNIIENGDYAGQTLEDIFKLDKSIVSENYSGDRFPLLIKFIDAEQDLSVQVHPGNEYAAKYANESGKTEMWYVIDSKPGAKIVYGLNNDYTREQLQNLIDCGRFEDCLNYVDAKPGDVFFIPAGLVHAIGAGILIAEIQQNSDTTYRFYDYNRLGADGKPRELHIQQALDVCIKTKTEYNPKIINNDIYDIYEVLCLCEYFKVTKVNLRSHPGTNMGSEHIGSFNSIICLDGECEMIAEENIYKIKKGDSYFLPPDIIFLQINKTGENCVFLLTTLGYNV